MKFLKISLSIFLIATLACCVTRTRSGDDKNITESKSLQLSESHSGFSKTLEFQGFKFEINSTGKGSIQQLTIQSYGLEIDQEFTLQIDGTIANAEIADLDADGYPELLIYIVSAGSGSYGHVIGYSVNNEKSINTIHFPSVADNSAVNMGYMGHDEFLVEESILMHRFKTYNEGDSNSAATGKIRQIQYKLVDSEKGRELVIDKVVDSYTLL